MRYQLNKTKMEKDEAEKEYREYKTKANRDLEIKDQVRVATSMSAAIEDITDILYEVDVVLFLSHLFLLCFF